ncbi:MAG: hypothetical protein ACKVW3_01005 [Phycisphaerales bacterium]
MNRFFISHAISVPALLAALCGTALAQGPVPYTEPFENNINLGGWTIVGGPGGSIIPTGGYPGAYFGGTNFDYPSLETRGRSSFTGDWSTRPSTTIDLDLVTYSQQGTIFPLSIMLLSDAGTPSDPSDDWGAWMLGTQEVPAAGTGWMYFSIQVPSGSTMDPPACWEYIDLGQNPPANRNWTLLMRDVTQVRLIWSSPGTTSNFPAWNIGIDNIRIKPTAFDSTCYANCSQGTFVPYLSVHDFICFNNAFASGCASPAPCYANCDGSTATPFLNVNDFICFLQKFAEGCTAP